MPIVKIPRARTVHKIPLSRFLPDQVKQAANPSDPNSIEICHFFNPKRPKHFLSCVYDRSQTIRQSDTNGSFGFVPEQEFGQFNELAAGNNRIYQPVFFCCGSAIANSMYDYYGAVASHLKGQWISRTYYDNFKTIVRQCGFTFIGGAHFPEASASFFIRGGARFLEEFIDTTLLKPWTSSLHSEERVTWVVTAHVLNHKGEKKLIHLELRDTSINERFALLARVQQVKQLIGLIQTAPSTNDAISTICEIMDDMKERGIPLPVDFLALNSNTVLARRVIARQSEMLWNHTYKLTTLYSDKEIKEFIGWLDQA